MRSVETVTNQIRLSILPNFLIVFLTCFYYFMIHYHLHKYLEDVGKYLSSQESKPHYKCLFLI